MAIWLKEEPLLEIINWKELLYPYEQAVEELLLKFRNLDKECRHLGIYSPIDSVSGRLKKPASILDKAGRKHIAPENIEKEIEDIAGIEVLVTAAHLAIDLCRVFG